MKYYLVCAENRTAFDSLVELYLHLQEDIFRFCYVESEDKSVRFPEQRDATERRVKGMVATRLLQLDEDWFSKNMDI